MILLLSGVATGLKVVLSLIDPSIAYGGIAVYGAGSGAPSFACVAICATGAAAQAQSGDVALAVSVAVVGGLLLGSLLLLRRWGTACAVPPGANPVRVLELLVFGLVVAVGLGLGLHSLLDDLLIQHLPAASDTFAEPIAYGVCFLPAWLLTFRSVLRARAEGVSRSSN